MIDTPKKRGISLSRRDFLKSAGAVATGPGAALNKVPRSLSSGITLPHFIEFMLRIIKDDQTLIRYTQVDFSGLAHIANVNPENLGHFLRYRLQSGGAMDNEMAQVCDALNLLSDAGKYYPNMRLKDFFKLPGGEGNSAEEYVRQAKVIRGVLSKIKENFKLNPDIKITDFVSNIADLWNDTLLHIIDDTDNFGDILDILQYRIRSGIKFSDPKIREALLNKLNRCNMNTILSMAKDALLSSDNKLSYFVFYVDHSTFVFESQRNGGVTPSAIVQLHPLNIAFWAVRNGMWRELKTWHNIRVQIIKSTKKELETRYIVEVKEPDLKKEIYHKFKAGEYISLPLVPFQTRKVRTGIFDWQDLPEQLRNSTLITRRDLDKWLDEGSII